jgi:hypothetical protein
VAEKFDSDYFYNASNDGLKIIADYIFGNNILARGGSEKLA